MEIKKRIVYSLGAMILLSACSPSEPSFVPSPRVLAYKMIKMNKYEDKYQIILGNFGSSLSKYAKLKYSSYKDINIEVYEVKNKTTDGALPFSSQGMLLNSVGMLTATSQNFFPLKKIMSDPGTITQIKDVGTYDKKVARVLQLEGSIDRSDIIYSKNDSKSADVTGTFSGHRIDGGYSHEDNDEIREISLSLRFIDKRDSNFNTYSRYGHAENSIRISKKTNGSGYGVFLFGSGISSSASETLTPGVHQAIKILVQHTVIQAFGRNFEVPYWNCSPMYKVDKVQKNNMKLEWIEKTKDEKIKEIQLVLNMYGFSIPFHSKDEEVKKLAIKKTKLALMSITKYLGIRGNVDNFDYYFKLYNNMPFAGFFPKNYTNLLNDINIINSGKLPVYKEPERTLPLAPKPVLQNSTTIIHTGDVSFFQDGSDVPPKPKPTAPSESNYYDKQKQEIDRLEADLFK